MAKENVLKVKSYDFALQIIKACMRIKSDHKEFDMSRQLQRSGTAIGALIREAEFGQSRADFAHKLSTSLKEANETDYWLSLLKDTGFIDPKSYESLSSICTKLIRMLVSSVKTAKSE